MVLLCLIFLCGLQNAQAQTARRSMEAIKGDGVYSLLRRAGLDPGQHLNQFLALNQENISEQNGLYVGIKYLLPVLDSSSIQNDSLLVKVKEPVSVKSKVKEVSDDLSIANAEGKPEAEKELTMRTYAIFGEKHESVTIESDELKGAVLYLISGHGGPDPGAVEHYDGQLISEDEYAYDVTLRLARKLISKGALVYLITRDADDGIRDERILKVDYDERTYPDKRIPRNQLLRLKQRVSAVNKLYHQNVHIPYQRIIETHVDSRSERQNIDVFFYYHESSEAGKQMATHQQTTFQQKYAQYQPNRDYFGTIEPRDLYVIKHSKAPTIYVEIGNIKNSRDQQRILKWENREAIAKWITEGVVTDFKSSK